MFDDIAFRYDFLNRFLSGGIDLWWRKKALSYLKKKDPKVILDVATGTGDVAIMASRLLKPTHITGIDISDGMLEVGRKKIEKLGLSKTIELLNGDSEAINFEDNTFDAVTVAFGVRNFQELEKGLSEILRVLKPSGQLFSKNRGAYQYLDESIQQFPEGKNFISILNNLGYHHTQYKPLSLGICSIYCGEKK
jgi:demethylmenaquinone methyltransferase/2-methoxy-6-polyprenyl-1,4-benzoquinol methylase